MKNLIITKKTEILKKEVENYQEILKKYSEQKRKISLKLQKLNDDYFNNLVEYSKYEKEVKNLRRKLTKLKLYIEFSVRYREHWLQLYTFNLLKDNKEIITQPLYFKREKERLFEHLNFEGLRFEVYKNEFLASYRGIVAFDVNHYTDSITVLNEDWLDDLSEMPSTLKYRFKNRYLCSKYFEDFAKEKYKKIIKIAKKEQKYIDEIEKERNELGNFRYCVAGLSLLYAKDWQKYKEF